uniref:rRNA adenine N(6)-methyltransferase n=1 Tax=Cynoglossus semilaevis TaxID=244447 RepID=A0A3P8VET6_CYNSE
MDFIIYSGVSDLWAISALGAVHHRCVDVPAAVSWSEAARQQESPTCVGAWSPRRSEVCVGTSSLDSEDCCCQQNRRQQTGHTHPLCQHEDLDVRDIEEKIRRTLGSRQQKHYLVDPQLATVVAQHLRTGDTDSVIFECNPGPGVLTRELINAGAQRVVALEGERSFLHDLRELEVQLGAQLEVLHCDYFKLDSVSYSRHNSPYMTSEELFSRLGISERAWTEGVPVKVVSILPQHKERNMLLKMVYVLLERMSVFRYGRIELNFFISEQEYLKMMSCPGDMINYRSSSVLWQMACDIRLLMKVPLESFVVTLPPPLKPTVDPWSVPNDHMCLVRLCPRPHLFSEGLNSSNARALVMLIRQCLVKRRSKLIDKLNQWSHKSGRLLLSEMALPRDVLTGHVSPDQYLRLFLLMHHMVGVFGYSLNTKSACCQPCVYI